LHTKLNEHAFVYVGPSAGYTLLDYLRAVTDPGLLRKHLSVWCLMSVDDVNDCNAPITVIGALQILQ